MPMQVIHHLEDVPSVLAGRPVAFTFGVFDGVHLGHRDLLHAVSVWARGHGSLAAVLTFTDHPLRLLAPAYAPPLLSSLSRRLRLIETAGIDLAAVIDFDREIADTPPEVFVRDIVTQRFHARAVFLGFNSRFGQGGGGDIALLERLAPGCGFEVRLVAPHLAEGDVVSSTQIRGLLRDGQVRRAAALLGRPHAVEGTVVEGRRRGHMLGYPTANLAIDEGMLIPGSGVYAVRAEAGGCLHGGMMNIGHRPTFEPGALSVEVHLFDFDGDLYGLPLSVEMIDRLRAERRFESPEALRHQLGLDAVQARQRLSRG